MGEDNKLFKILASIFAYFPWALVGGAVCLLVGKMFIGDEFTGKNGAQGFVIGLFMLPMFLLWIPLINLLVLLYLLVFWLISLVCMILNFLRALKDEDEPFYIPVIGSIIAEKIYDICPGGD